MYSLFYATTAIQRNFLKTAASYPHEDQEMIWDSIEELRKNPFPRNSIKIKPPQWVLNREANYRLKSPPYRIFYDVYRKEKRIYLIYLTRRNEQTYK